MSVVVHGYYLEGDPCCKKPVLVEIGRQEELMCITCDKIRALPSQSKVSAIQHL